MKRIAAILSALVLCAGGTAFAAETAPAGAAQKIIMQIGSPTMTVDGVETAIDPDGAETAPAITDGRTLLPVRAVVEAMGGNVSWDNAAQTVSLVCGDAEIRLTIGSTQAVLNDAPETLDVAPVIIGGRTMLPIRFIAENFGYLVGWTGRIQTITIIKAASGTPVFDLTSKTVTLNNGVVMPANGLGTYLLTTEEAEISANSMLTQGGRLIDTANAYMNERAVGRGIISSGVPREEIFITTKLWPSDYENVEKAIDDTLARLQLDYIDLLLLHQPLGNYVAGYKGMEEALRQGKVRAIGLSNFYEERFNEIMSVAEITPAVLQIEANPYVQQEDLGAYVRPYGTVLMAWFPLGGRVDERNNTQTRLFSEPKIVEIAEKYDKSAAQVILRWHLQSGIIAIPGSTNPAHILENIEVYDFELTAGDMASLKTLDTATPSFDFRNMNDNGGIGTFTAPMDFNAQE